MNSILVVGSTGTVGSALTSKLAAAGESVRAATRNPASLKTQPRVEAVRFDYTDRTTFASALEGVNRVFVLEPQTPGHGTVEVFLLPFLQSAAMSGRKVVLMSSLSAEFDETEPLRTAEAALERSGAPFIILRPNWFMDNFHGIWLPPIVENGLIPLPAGNARCSFIDTRDIASAASAALRSDAFNGRKMTLTGPESLTHDEVAEIISAASGEEISYVPVDDTSFIASLVAAGLPQNYAEYIARLFEGTRYGSTADVSGGVAELTGHQPRSFTQYAHDHAAVWQRGHKARYADVS